MRRFFLFFFIVLIFILSSCGNKTKEASKTMSTTKATTNQTEANSFEYVEFTNPVVKNGADPWVIRDGDIYYYCYSAGNGVCVSTAERLNEISTETGVRVYTAPKDTMYSAEYWAPELHKINGKWYIYVAADDGDNVNHRMYVLECEGSVPTDSFKMVGKISDDTDLWAIDGTVLQYENELYFIWSGSESAEIPHQCLFIAHMSSPTEIDGKRIMLSRPEYEWEVRGGNPKINEGPVALIRGKSVHIIYSASGSWSDFYCLGRLTFKNGVDILDPDYWEKSDRPVFEGDNGVYAPGHCSFAESSDGTTWMIYHSNLEKGTSWGGRSVSIKPIRWNGENPIFGEPPAVTEVLKISK